MALLKATDGPISQRKVIKNANCLADRQYSRRKTEISQAFLDWKYQLVLLQFQHHPKLVLSAMWL